MIKEIKPGAEQLRTENAARLRSEALNRALLEANSKLETVESNYQNFVTKTFYAFAFALILILAETAIIWTQTQKECAPLKTWGNPAKSQTTDAKKGIK